MHPALHSKTHTHTHIRIHTSSFTLTTRLVFYLLMYICACSVVVAGRLFGMPCVYVCVRMHAANTWACAWSWAYVSMHAHIHTPMLACILAYMTYNKMMIRSMHTWALLWHKEKSVSCTSTVRPCAALWPAQALARVWRVWQQLQRALSRLWRLAWRPAFAVWKHLPHVSL